MANFIICKLYLNKPVIKINHWRRLAVESNKSRPKKNMFLYSRGNESEQEFNSVFSTL